MMVMSSGREGEVSLGRVDVALAGMGVVLVGVALTAGVLVGMGRVLVTGEVGVALAVGWGGVVEDLGGVKFSLNPMASGDERLILEDLHNSTSGKD